MVAGVTIRSRRFGCGGRQGLEAVLGARPVPGLTSRLHTRRRAASSMALWWRGIAGCYSIANNWARVSAVLMIRSSKATYVVPSSTNASNAPSNWSRFAAVGGQHILAHAAGTGVVAREPGIAKKGAALVLPIHTTC